MAFVYRYFDRATCRYIGMVKGKTPDCLERRLKQHASRDGFPSTWRIEYVEVSTRTDADLLESHLINECATPEFLLNKAKRTHGAITIACVPPLRWRRWRGSLIPKRKLDYINRIKYILGCLGWRSWEFECPENLELLTKEQLYELLKEVEAFRHSVLSRKKETNHEEESREA